ncbi:MAG: MFS transporter [Salinisphaera sp.]|jgi:MFS family permease|nr:MFS transporter [Salinisphaera sp.]
MAQIKTSTPAASPLPAGIWALGFVSLFMDISSEMIHALLPVFLVTVLGASTLTVGAIEGIGEATAAVTKLFSGWLSDRLGQRKLLTVIGYGLGALSKPLFALALSPAGVLVARVTDRVGKGVRGAPRDALVGDLAPPGMQGAAFGLRQSLDTVGAFIGPLLAIALMALFHDRFRLVFWCALIPGFVAVTILVLAVREPPRRIRGQRRTPINWQELRNLDAGYWRVLGVGVVLNLARFSEAFLILRATGLGLPLVWTPIVLVVMNIVYALTAYPVGVLSDKASKRFILFAGFLVLIAADMVLSLGAGLTAVMLGIGLWGLHMGLTQGLLARLVADTAPARLRGTAFGVFHLTTGLAILTASLIAGGLWDWLGPAATFLAGAGFTVVGLIGAVVTKAAHEI